MMNPKKVYVFIFSAVAVFALLIYGAAVRQGWFESMQTYVVRFPSGDGLYSGTVVTITGLRAGAVKKVSLDADNQVVVELDIQKKYASHIRQDSVAEMGRYFVIGERFISIQAGSKDLPELPEGSELKGKVNFEITDLLSGQVLGKYLEVFNSLMKQLAVVIQGDGKNSQTLVDMYKQAFSALKSVEKMGDVVGHQNTGVLIRELAQNAQELTSLIRQLNSTMPQVGALAGNLDHVMPELSKTLTQTTLTLQALQKTFILRGAVREVVEEQDKENNRSPAAAP